MKKITLKGLLVATAFLFAIAGCGGGGGTTQPSTATLTLSTVGTLAAGTQIGGISATVALPAGVTLSTSAAKAVPSGIVTYSGLVTPSGVAVGANTMALATFSAPSTMIVELANPVGFGVGEFATVVCNIDVGASVTDASFSNPTVTTAYDLNGVPIPGIVGKLAAVVQ